MSSHKSAWISLHLTAFLMGATGLFSKIIALPAWDITGYRTWIAALVLFAWVAWRERHIRLNSGRDYWRMLVLGILLALHWVSFFYSMQVANIAVGMLSLYAYPVVTVFLEPWIKRTRLDWRDVVSGFLVVIGIYCLVPEFDISNNMTQGVIWGVISALTFAVRNLLLSHWFSGQSASRSMSYQVLIVALVMTPVIWLSPHQPTSQDWWLLILLGVFFTAITHSLLGHSLRYLKAKTVGLVTCLQPVYAVGYEIVILNEYPDQATLIGGAIIIGAAIYESVREHRRG
ncbi:DMT family transporter [Cellvibrio japonicus]|uniref:Putative membrane protein n=1 Tax=Cellvibrio japonicus (strain Ueda107) TaxID=498211 RepID=B3PLE6_CELJU|nr:DMT family transporter [Cellvibrio japonicus]ACE84738.1 putative membrane protein [Cellvibrio japonicus Ueda107]QEI11596.1 DMT family transporter [Cellvibrio japonicus]QEI15170.1 DMT family transporter [Cellvibrio japonicus]QEI18750.1 DMT family transporter [Cellvibrio japonicus]